MDLVFLDRLADSRANGDQDRLRNNDNFVEDKAHVGEPDLSERDEQDSVWTDALNLAVPDVGEVQGQKSLLDVLNGRSGPQELEDDILPDSCFGWTVKEQMAGRVQRGQAKQAIGGLKHMGHHIVQSATIRDAPIDETVYHITLDIGK